MALSLRSLASDTAVYGLSTIAGRFLTFILTPFYTHYLSGPSEYGHIATIYAVIAFMNIAYSFGFDTAFMRFYSKDNVGYSQQVYNTAFWSIAGISLSITLVASLCIIVFPLQLEGIHTSATTLLLCAAIIPLLDALMIIPYAHLRMERRSKRFALTKFFIIVLNVSLNILFVGTLHYGALGVIISGILSSAFGVLLLLPDMLPWLRLRISSPLLKDMLKFGLPTVPAAFSTIALQLLDRPIVGILTDSRNVGIYQANYRLALPMMMFISVFETAWKPFYLTNAEKPEAKKLFAQVLTIFTAVCAVIFIIVTLFMSDIVALPFRGATFIHPQYWSGLHIIPLILAGYWFNGFYIQFSAGFHITKQTKYLPIAMGTAAVTTVILNFALVPQWGISGAAIAMMLSYCVAACILLFYARRIYPLDYEWNTIALLIGLALSTFIVFTLFSPLTLLLKILMGITSIVMISLLLLRKKSLIQLLKRT